MKNTCYITAISLLVFLTGCVSFPEAGTERGITKGPVILRAEQRRVAIMWETEHAGRSILRYGPDSATTFSVTSKPVRIKDGGKGKGDAYIHKVWVTGLQPGRQYAYRIEGPRVTGQTHSFKTVPAETDKARFIVYGDTRTHPEIHRKLVRQMTRIPDIDFMVHVGDLVTSGDKYEQWGPQHFDVVKGLAESIPMYVAKGNHEGSNGNFEKLFNPPGISNAYAFDFGPVHYYIGVNAFKQKSAETRAMLDAITRDAKASAATWKFVSYHVPSLNYGHHWSAWAYPDALPELAEANVDLVLSGHSHLYERFKPVAPAVDAAGSYVTYITTGGGGAPIHDVDKTGHHAVALRTYEFCLFEIEGTKLTMTVFDTAGRKIDQLQLTKTDGRLDTEYLATATSMAEILEYQKKKGKKSY